MVCNNNAVLIGSNYNKTSKIYFKLFVKVKFKSESDSLVCLDHPISIDSVLTKRSVPVVE